jgi:outer membrane protein OmpA-like peptidoglycan-associated protein
VDKDKWFDFHDLNFKFGTAEIVPESRNEVANIEKILKAYPKVKIKIGGYTDKVGDEAANKKLSNERANAVKQDMKTAGVGGQVSDAEGYGSQFAKYPADAPEEDRIKDRRVSVSVREK